MDFGFHLDPLEAGQQLPMQEAQAALLALSIGLRAETISEFLQQQNPRDGHSYFHDNGFLKIELARSQRGLVRLRLHIWGLTASRHPQRIHSHNFDFVSKVIDGSFVSRRYEVEEGQSGVLYHRLGYHRRLRTDSHTYRLVPRGQCTARLVAEDILVAGDTYRMRGIAYHTLDPLPPGRAMTVAITREHDDSCECEVLFDSAEAHLVDRNYRQLDSDSVAKAVAALYIGAKA